jgi:hypothetical protein
MEVNGYTKITDPEIRAAAYDAARDFLAAVTGDAPCWMGLVYWDPIDALDSVYMSELAWLIELHGRVPPTIAWGPTSVRLELDKAERLS